MPGASRLTIEKVIQTSVPDNNGIERVLALPIESSRVGLAPISGSTTPETVAIETNQVAAKWDHGDGTSHILSWQFPMPFDYNPYAYGASPTSGSMVQQNLYLKADMRKIDSADENADLAYTCKIYFRSTGDADLSTNTTVISQTLSATLAAASTNLDGFITYTWDIGAALRTDSLRIDPGDILRICIAPHETVGTTDMDVELTDAVLYYRATAAGISTVANRSV
ncbi:MAG: hypothetical protein EBR82_50695 [Caulobacteraceae bacterium]|nr:hypothetical protein [Caulobacteraceae bacterium]